MNVPRTSTFALLLALAAPLAGEYGARVDLKNTSGEVKQNWPVILRVYTIFGRNLRPESLRADSYHVYDPAGNEIPCDIEVVPPSDQPGNDDLVFIVPRITPGETLSFRITNDGRRSRVRRTINTVNSPHNLVRNGSFEGKESTLVDGFSGVARNDPSVRHNGAASLVLTADAETVSAESVSDITLHKGSWYYFGAWSKTRNVSRFGYEAGKAAHFKFADPDAPQGKAEASALGVATPQCSTRDWLKVTFEPGITEWGVERYAAKAQAARTRLAFVLEQRRHYYMEPGQSRGTWWLDDVVLMEQPEVTVRFDLALQPLLEKGIFLFTRPVETPLGRLIEQENQKPVSPPRTVWVGRPFAHEKLIALDRFALRGQRVSLCLGAYHTREVRDVVVRLAGGAVVGPVGAKVPLESLEFMPGYSGPGASRYMPVLNSGPEVEPVALEGTNGVRYFFLTFHVPRDAKPGRYTGAVEVLLGQNTLFRRIPVVLRVQDLVQPEIRDLYVGLIYNGGLPDIDGMLRQYARSGFTQIMWFHGFIPYRKGDDGRMHIDGPSLEPKMKQLVDLGITAGCGLYTDVQLDDRPKGHQGRMIRIARDEAAAALEGQRESVEKAAYGRLLKELDALAKAHPEWPTILHMNWDEPPPFSERMGWTNEILPEAVTTLDVQFARLPKILPYYNTPNFDDPANWAGPELYRYMRRIGKNFGLCGAADTGEANRYQAGLFMVTSGAKYFHAWHIRGGHTPGQMAYDERRGWVIRGHEMISWANGMDDLKAYRLLRDAIEESRRTGRNSTAARSAEDYLAKVLAVFNGDHEDHWSLQPYLGTAFSWGYERFYDDWQEQMAKHAARIRNVPWIN